MKSCSICGLQLNTLFFAQRKTSKDGLEGRCKSCTSKKSKHYWKANPEKLKIKSQNYRIKNQEKLRLEAKAWRSNNPEKSKEHSKKWAKANPLAMSQIRARSYKKNKESLKVTRATYQKKNPEIFKIASQKRRAKLASNGIYLVTPKEIRRMLANSCAYCEKQSQHVDHIVPVSRGGTHSIGNLIGACASCNQSKSDKFITEWKKIKPNEGK